MINALIEKVKGFLVNPADAFRQVKGDETAPVFTYFAVLLLVYALLSALVSAVMGWASPVSGLVSWGLPAPLTVFLVILVGGFIGALVFGAWLHLFVYILGGRGGIWQTIKAVMYADTPQLLFGWIPFIGFLASLWTIWLGIVGIHELQEISTARSILAVAIAVMVPLILLVLIASYFFIAYTTTTAVPFPVTGAE